MLLYAGAALAVVLIAGFVGRMYFAGKSGAKAPAHGDAAEGGVSSSRIQGALERAPRAPIVDTRPARVVAPPAIARDDRDAHDEEDEDEEEIDSDDEDDEDDGGDEGDEYDHEPDLDPEVKRKLRLIDAGPVSFTCDAEAADVLRLSADPSPRVREQACYLLGPIAMIGDYDSPARRAALLARVDDPHWRARAYALLGLAEREDVRAIAPLARALEGLADAHDAVARTQAAHPGIVWSHLTPEETSLYRAQLDATNAGEHVINAAWHLPDASFAPALERLTAHVVGKDVRDALAKCGAMARGPWGASTRARAAGGAPAADVRLDDDALYADRRTFDVALRRADALTLFSSLRPFARSEPAALHMGAAKELREECHRRPENEIFDLAQVWAHDPDPDKRATAAIALGRTPDDDEPAPDHIVSLLLNLVEDDVPAVAMAALASLGERTRRDFDEDTRAMLRACEMRPEDEVRLAYARMHRSPYMHDHLRGEEDVDVWARLLRDPAASVRAEAAAHVNCCLCSSSDWVVEVIGRPDIRRALLDTMSDADPRVRVASLNALVRMNDLRGMAAAEAALDDSLRRMPSLDAAGLCALGEELCATLEGFRSPRITPKLRQWKKIVEASDIDCDAKYHYRHWIDGAIAESKAA